MANGRELGLNKSSSCDGKAAFQSRTLAANVAGRVRERKGRAHVYSCPFCGQFHVGQHLKSKGARR
jgi:hypothetical protein